MLAKTILRDNIARLLYLIGLTKPERHSRGQLSIVTFHRTLPEAERQCYPFPGLVVTPDELDLFLAYFTEHFDCGALAVQHERYLSGKNSTRPLLALTFDDAQYDNFCNARTLLNKYQLKASFFVPVIAVVRQELLWHDRLGFSILNLLKQDRFGQEKLEQILAKTGLSSSGPSDLVINIVEKSKRLNLECRLKLVEDLIEASGNPKVPDFARLMTFEELAELAADGHEIGSHSMTHCMMPECDDLALTYEVEKSRQELQVHLGQPIETFCYPNGNSNARTALAVAQAGYRRAVNTTWGSNGIDADTFQLHRYDMVAKRVQDSNGKFSPSLLAFRMSRYFPGQVS